MSTRTHGVCRVCKQTIPLGSDERCVPHGQWRPARGIAEIECDGTGRLPLTESDHTSD